MGQKVGEVGSTLVDKTKDLLPPKSVGVQE